jgi:hypothetical protein
VSLYEWGIHLLVSQLVFKDNAVRLAALSTLEECVHAEPVFACVIGTVHCVCVQYRIV